MLCALDASPALLSTGQHVLFGSLPAASDEDRTRPPMLPPYIIEQLIRPIIRVGRTDHDPPPPPQTIVTLSDRSGLLEISNHYDRTYQAGRISLQNIYGALEGANASQDPAEIVRLLEGTAADLGTFRGSAVAVRDVHTRHGRSEYATIENWLNILYGDRRAQMSGSNPTSTPTLRLVGAMLGFNLAAINKQDATYRTGTAVKLLIEREARAVAEEWGNGARGLGLWGTNTVVSGIPEGRAGEFRQEVLTRVVAFLRTNQELPPEICAEMGTSRLRTADLAAASWITADPDRIGLTAGHHSLLIDPAQVRPGEADIRVIELLERLSECEREAGRLGRTVFAGEVPADSPVRGRSGRPILQTQAVIAPGTAPHDVAPLPAPDPNAPNQTTPTPDEIRSGRLPRPAHEAGHAIGQADRLQDLIARARNAAGRGDTVEAHRLIDETMAAMNNPENRPPEARRSMLEFYDRGYRVSLEQHRFPGVFRLEMFPQIAQRTFGGERFFIQMAEYRDYWGHNRAHAPDAGDSMHRLTMDILMRGYEYHGVEVLTGTQGGDEVFFAIRGRTNDGRALTDADVARISDYLATNFNRVFENVEHHEVTKVPMMPGGRFAGRNYLLHEGRLYVEQGAYTAEQLTELRETVRIAYGQTIEPANVTEVEGLSKVGQVERLRLWSRVDTASGRVIEVFRPIGETPEGFSEVRIPLSTTISSAVEVPSGSGPEVVRLAMDRAGQQADQMKREGVDRPRAPEDPATAGPDPVVRIPLTERLNATRGGRLFLNGGLFAVGDVLSEGVFQLFTGQSRIGSLDFYMQMAQGYVLMTAGTMGGETFGRAGVAALDRNLFVRQGERMILNDAAFRTELTGLRGAGVHGAGILGAVLLSELVAQGHIQPTETAWTLGGMGAAMGTSRLALYGVGASLEATGVIAGTTRTALMRHPVTAVAVVVAECLIMKGINHLRAGWAREDAETEMRVNLGSAMRRLDYVIARNVVIRPDGTVDETAQEEYQTAVRRVTEAFGDTMVFRFAHNTDQGRTYLDAQQTLADRQRRLTEVAGNYPDLAEQIQRDPGSEERFIRERVQFYEDHGFLDSMGRGIGQVNRSTELRNALDHRNTARTELQTAEQDFQNMIRRRLQEASPASFPMPFHQSADGFRDGLRSDPVQIYQQFQSYLTARMAYSDQVRTHGPDAAAIEAHYAPLAPAIPAEPLALDPFLLSPQVQPLDSLFVDPFRIPLPQDSPFVLSEDSVLFRPTATVADPAATSPLFYLDSPGHVRLLRSDDTLTSGAVWVFNTETRRYETMRDLPAIDMNGGNGRPTIDMSSGRTRLVAQPQGPAHVLTVDLRGARSTFLR